MISKLRNDIYQGFETSEDIIEEKVISYFIHIYFFKKKLIEQYIF